MEEQEKKLLKAGKIAREVKKYAKEIIKPGVLLVEIADKIEDKIEELGGKPAFPTGLSINDVAAHSTPQYNDETKAHGLLKVDLGVNIGGYLSDTAFSLDLENNPTNKKLIEASDKALENAIEKIKQNQEVTLSEIGKTIQKTITGEGFTPIANLSGHSIERYNLHSGTTIPNIENNNSEKLFPGLFAIEPFSTNGSGKVYDSKPSGIYILTDQKNIRNPLGRKILKFIIEEYNSLPFCSRWIVKKFGTRALFSLKILENNGNLYQFSQLIEASHNKVSQSEHSILFKEEEVVITT